MDDEYFAKSEECAIQARTNALESVNKLGLPKLVDLSEDSFSGLGPKTVREASKALELLRDLHGDKLQYLIGLALRESWFALFNGSGYMALMMAGGLHAANDVMRKLADVDGYGEYEGIAWVLYGHLNSIEEAGQQSTFRDGTPFADRLSIGDILNGAAVYWFAAAAISRREDNMDGAFDWLCEAHIALSLAQSDIMWDESAGLERESITENSVTLFSKARSTLAKKAAHARHAETRNMKVDVFAWLDANRRNFNSMEAAAAEIIKQQPIKFRTASVWGAEWKKLRSASKP